MSRRVVHMERLYSRLPRSTEHPARKISAQNPAGDDEGNRKWSAQPTLQREELGDGDWKCSRSAVTDPVPAHGGEVTGYYDNCDPASGFALDPNIPPDRS